MGLQDNSTETTNTTRGYTCEHCGETFKYLSGRGNAKPLSLRDHSCKAITPLSLLHPEWADLRARVLKLEGVVEVKRQQVIVMKW